MSPKVWMGQVPPLQSSSTQSAIPETRWFPALARLGHRRSRQQSATETGSRHEPPTRHPGWTSAVKSIVCKDKR